MTKGTRVILYRRCSTEEQGASGLGLEAQLASLQRAADYHGWIVVGDEADVASGGKLSGRDGLARALERLDAGEADALAVAKLDRLSRSIIDFAGMVERAQRKQRGKAPWAIISLDPPIDQTTATGRMQASLVVLLASWERELASERTRAAMAQLPRDRRNGNAVYPDNVRARIVALKAEGLSLRRIGAQLEAEGITTFSGRPWHPSTLAQIIEAG